MERNSLSVGADLFLGMIMKHFSRDTIEIVGSFLDSLRYSETVYKENRLRLLNLLESGATEAEMIAAAKK